MLEKSGGRNEPWMLSDQKKIFFFNFQKSKRPAKHFWTATHHEIILRVTFWREAPVHNWFAPVPPPDLVVTFDVHLIPPHKPLLNFDWTLPVLYQILQIHLFFFFSFIPDSNRLPSQIYSKILKTDFIDLQICQMVS